MILVLGSGQTGSSIDRECRLVRLPAPQGDECGSDGLIDLRHSIKVLKLLIMVIVVRHHIHKQATRQVLCVFDNS